MYFLFKMGIFHCYVCLPEGRICLDSKFENLVSSQYPRNPTSSPLKLRYKVWKSIEKKTSPKWRMSKTPIKTYVVLNFQKTTRTRFLWLKERNKYEHILIVISLSRRCFWRRTSGGMLSSYDVPFYHQQVGKTKHNLIGMVTYHAIYHGRTYVQTNPRDASIMHLQCCSIHFAKSSGRQRDPDSWQTWKFGSWQGAVVNPIGPLFHPFSSFLREEAFLSADLRSVSICLNCFHHNIIANTFKDCKKCKKRHLTKQSHPRNLFPLPPASPGSFFCSLSPRARWDRVLSFEENDSTAARDACDRSDLGLTSRPRANHREPPQIDKWRISSRKKKVEKGAIQTFFIWPLSVWAIIRIIPNNMNQPPKKSWYKAHKINRNSTCLLFGVWTIWKMLSCHKTNHIHELEASKNWS